MAHATEDAARRFKELDTWPSGEILEALWSSQSRALAACLQALPALERAVDRATARLSDGGGRLVYVGAGTSGMIAALDATELEATFGWPAERMAVFLPGTGDPRGIPDPASEDDAAEGRRRASQLDSGDVILGVSASGGSGYTVGAVEEAGRRGALTIALVSLADSPLVRAAEHALVVPTGTEVIAGSTRLAAGTAQKVMLNLFSTAVMVGLGLVFDNLMIDVRPDNAKLRQRRVAIVARIASVDGAVAADALARHGDVKRAVLGLAGLSDAEVETALATSGGNLRVALRGIPHGGNGA